MPPAGRQERRRRRALLRASHPDLGGDAETFIRVAAALGAGGGRVPAAPADEVRFVRRPRGLARLAAWVGKQQRRGGHGGPPRVS